MAGLAGNWQLSDKHVAQLREYLLRGGFIFFDSFFGSNSWIGFEHGLNRIFPDRPTVDVPSDHPVFHIVHDLTELTRAQIPNMNSLMRGAAVTSATAACRIGAASSTTTAGSWC